MNKEMLESFAKSCGRYRLPAYVLGIVKSYINNQYMTAEEKEEIIKEVISITESVYVDETFPWKVDVDLFLENKAK